MGTLFGASGDPANGSSPDAAVVRDKLNHLVEQLQDHLMNWNDDPDSSTPKADLRAPATTVMVFHQSAAPALWTKIVDAARDNIALRIVTTTAFVAGAQGGDSFTTVFGTGKTTGSHTLVESEIPGHVHKMGARAVSSGTCGVGASALHGCTSTIATGPDSESTGGDGGHTHTLTVNLKYINVILASKD